MQNIKPTGHITVTKNIGYVIDVGWNKYSTFIN